MAAVERMWDFIGIADDVLEKHATFMARLRQSHGRKHGFWSLMKL